MKPFFSPRKYLQPGLLSLIALSVAPVWAQTQPNYTARKDGYAVWLPTKPQKGSRQVATSAGPMNAQFVTSKSGPLTYIVIPVPLPSRIPSAKRGEFLQGVERGFMQSVRQNKGRLQSSRALTYRGFMGREISVSLPPNAMRARFLIASLRCYQIIVVGPKGALNKNPAQVQKVLNSFKILPL